VVKERINEIIDFAKSEAPYKTSNKGWIKGFIFFELWPSAKGKEEEKEEIIKISLHQNKLVRTLLFGIAFIPALLLLAFSTFF
tara:strand:- start:435 stop:683 length:249 start_codon:yes stop_codon:yes gene_type:complete